jgi:recombination protein RecA
MGGFARGQIIDFYGDEALGKTTVALRMAAERTVNKEKCLFIDVEHRLTSALKKIMIPNWEQYFKVIEAPTGDSALRTLEKAVRTPEFRMIIMDSLAAIITEDEMDPDGSPGIAKTAREIGKSIKRLMTPVSKYGSIVVLINQIRMNPMPSYGQNPRTVTGGKAPKYFSSLRLGIYKDQPVKDGDVLVGQKLRIKVEKNLWGAPEGIAYATLLFGYGIDLASDFVETSKKLGLIQSSGPWMTWNDGKQEIKGHGEKDLLEKIGNEFPKFLAIARQRIVDLNKTITPPIVAVEKDDEDGKKEKREKAK